MDTILEQLSLAVDGSGWIALLASFCWGVLSILLSPCHLASIPLIVGFIGDQGRMSTGRSFRISILFSIGILASIAAIGIAAHEAGHAVQHQQNYAPFSLRSTLVPAANLGSTLLWPMLIFGLFLNIPIVAQIGVWLFMFAVAFHLVTLPVEFDASRRALACLRGHYVTEAEYDGAKKVLNAAAMTYVAAFVTSLLTLLYWAMRLGLLGGRSDD